MSAHYTITGARDITVGDAKAIKEILDEASSEDLNIHFDGDKIEFKGDGA